VPIYDSELVDAKLIGKNLINEMMIIAPQPTGVFNL
jgi:hypothetical protein